MCGIAGIWRQSPENSIVHDNFCQDVLRILHHRGPDGSGLWRSDDTDITLLHRRLSIVDLSVGGHQPMRSQNDRFVISYNGEIYNHAHLRAEMENEGVEFKSTSDTEVLLEAFSHWGIPKTLQRINGMFAIALFDKKLSKLILFRDRIGEKPLYYGSSRGDFFFSSELKALHAWPNFKPKISRDAVQSFMEFGFVPAPFSIYSDVFKLKPGHFVEIQKGIVSQQSAYWDLDEKIRTIEKRQDNTSALFEDLEILLSDAVALRMRSDVPTGTFLSGGVDSSLITALIQSQSEKRFSSYTIGFEDVAFDESEASRKIARHIGTDHSEYQISNSELLSIIPNLPEVFCEPLADESQIPTILVSQLARQDVTVILSGDGGDEIFGGYNRHITSKTLSQISDTLPSGIRSLIATALRGECQSQISGLARMLGREVSGNQLHKLARLFDKNVTADLYRNYLGSPESQALLSSGHGEVNIQKVTREFSTLNTCEGIMANDQLFYLPGNILVKLDRSSMANSLETRLPYLDHRVVEFGWTLPLKYKVRRGTGKVLLRKLLYKYVPKELFSVNKRGFDIPLSDWLRGPLKEWAHELICNSGENEFINMEKARSLWNAHIYSEADYSKPLWNTLTFLAWHKHWHG